MAIAALAVSSFIGVMRYIDKAPGPHPDDENKDPSKDVDPTRRPGSDDKAK
jgi:hypothetical protein